MGFWFLDDKTQIALLLAGLLSSGCAAGCDDGRPVPTDTNPSDGSIDWPVVDMVPPDAQPDVPIADPLPPPDAGYEVPIADPLPPPDAQPDVPIADPLPPPDAQSAFPIPTPFPPGQAGQPLPFNRDLRRQKTPTIPPGMGGHRLPLERGLGVQIQAHLLGDSGQLELVAHCRGAAGRELSYKWIASAGALEETGGPRVRWTPPATPGRQMVQVVIRDGERRVAVEVFHYTID